MDFNGTPVTGLVDTTMGRMIFNRPIPQDLGYVDRSTPEEALKFEVDFLVGKKQLGNIIDRCIKVHGTEHTAEVLDEIKAQGYKYSTISGITVAVSDATLPAAKKDILAAAEKEIDESAWSTPRASCPIPSATTPCCAPGKKPPTTSPTPCRRAWTATTPST